MLMQQQTYGNWLAIALFVLTCVWHAPAAADAPPLPPDLAPCIRATAPELPTRWRAIGLMLSALRNDQQATPSSL
jgi:hypothetical protein